MAKVTITLPSSIFSTLQNGSRTWDFVSADRPDLGSSLSATDNSIYFDLLILPHIAGLSVQMRLARNRTEGDFTAGPDFSDQMEQNGTITIVDSDGVTLVISGIGDSTEPYSWMPSNQSAVNAFVAGLPNNKSLTVTFNDNAGLPIFLRQSGAYVERTGVVYRRESGVYVEKDATLYRRVSGAYVEA